MNAMMVHRGPDDEGFFIDPSGVALGARRLSVIDVDGGHQPIANEDGTVWAVLNGEIYNHPALQRELLARGHELRSRTDTEVLVHLYEEYGDAMVHALEGMYSFAIWDSRRQRMLIARDRFGEKPLFYRSSGERLTFASELTALQAGLSSSDSVDPVSVTAFLMLGYVPGERSMLCDTRQLPPASTLVWSTADPAARVTRYWRLPALRPSPGPTAGRLTEELDVLFARAVGTKLIADVPVGIFLSGGVDSTLVAAYAARASRGPVQTFTVGYDRGQVDETSDARRVARVLGTVHHEIVLTSDHVATQVPEMLRRLDQPVADPAIVALHGLCGFARERITVAVGGEGADELFAGYPRYRWLALSGLLTRHAPDSVLRAGAGVLRAAGLRGRLARLPEVLGSRDVVERHVDWVTDGRATGGRQIWGRALRDVAHQFDPAADARRVLAECGARSIVRSFMHLDQERWLPDNVLAKADRSSMLHSLEVRAPFLDRALAEFAASVPIAAHAGPRDKNLLRTLFEQTLPELGPAKRKTAFRVPLADWLRGPLRPALETQMKCGRAFSEEWLDRRAVTRLVEEHQSGRADHARQLWALLTFGSWLDAQRGVPAR